MENVVFGITIPVWNWNSEETVNVELSAKGHHSVDIRLSDGSDILVRLVNGNTLHMSRTDIDWNQIFLSEKDHIFLIDNVCCTEVGKIIRKIAKEEGICIVGYEIG